MKLDFGYMVTVVSIQDLGFGSRMSFSNGLFGWILGAWGFAMSHNPNAPQEKKS